MMPTPALWRRLHRAAQEIEAQARSRSRQPSQMMRFQTGAALNWSFNGGDLLHILQRNGIELVDTAHPARREP